jgi:HlyD family type I secretion membrane fusion protein
MLLKDKSIPSLNHWKSDDFLPPISLWTKLGGLFLVSTVGIAIVLAANLPYRVVVKAPATVRPMGEIKLVQATTTGIVSKILVRENQRVQQGDPIVRLELAELQTQRNQLQSSQQNIQAQLAQNMAELSALDKQRTAEQQLLTHTLDISQETLNRSQKDYQTQRLITQTDIKEANAIVATAQERLNRYRPLAEQGAVSKIQLNEKEEALAVAQAKLERAQAAANPSDAPVSISTTQIAQEQAKGESALAKLDQTEQTLLKARNDLQTQLEHDRQQLQQVNRDLQKGEILAPHSGTVLKLDLRNVGQIVQPGATIAQIAPDPASLTVKASVVAQDISQVKVCDLPAITQCQTGKAQLRISAYPYPDYGVLYAAVRSIAPDTATRKEDPTGAIASYEVTLEVERPYFLRAGQQYPIQIGMDGTIEITSQEESFLTFILRKTRLLTNM